MKLRPPTQEPPKPGKRQIQIPTKQTVAATNPLTKLEAATETLLLFQEQHEKTLTRLDALKAEVAIAEDEVKTFCKENKRSLESDLFIAKFSQPKTRWHDPDKLREALGKEWKDSLRAKTFMQTVGLVKITEAVDEKLLQKLIEAEKVPATVARAAYREEDYGGPRVQIERKA